MRTLLLIAIIALILPSSTGPETIGHSVHGMPLIVQQFGDGPVPVLLVGGIHGGYEANTVVLMNELGAYFHNHPEAIAPVISLYIIPAANPDGLFKGRGFAARFNAHGVDLNRNWACGWQPEADAGSTPVDPGPAPFSEPETQALADYILALQPAAVIWYHSAADGIFPGACEGVERGGSSHIAELLSQATGYPTGIDFSEQHYHVTGTASDWVDALGIPAMALELSSDEDTEFARNLAGVMALQCHYTQLAAPTWHLDNLYRYMNRFCEDHWLTGEKP